ncbi:MAG: xanthine dehydrogenase family protein molybdopterin-binding subunit [Betaproteobacteria bacterium]|nr:xanthine dehydrogenase family protein molybdopterin-binding subunit [Betaproteobacteria bacterium]
MSPADKPIPRKLPGSLEGNRTLDRWLRINRDGTVTIFPGKVEIGQGILTALVQIVAEELDVAIERIRIAPADTSYSPDEGMTSGSRSIQEGGMALRYAAAEARDLLLARAAAKLGVSLEQFVISDGEITARSGGRTTYWELSSEQLLQREATAEVAPKPAAQHVFVGTSVPRRDIPAKVTGVPSYVHDMELPGMLHGRVARPPSRRAQLAALDEAEVRALPGVTALVRDGNFLGVIAEREEQAIRAQRRLARSARWDETATLPDSTDPRYLLGMKSEDEVISEKSAAAAMARAAQTLEAEYTRPLIAHASIGPSCAVATFEDGRYTVWTHSQGIFPLRGDLAKVLGVAEGNIVVIHVEGAGCYGHNGADDAALDAALLARAVPGRPVRLQWMREDEFEWEPYGSAMVIRLSAALDATGHIVSWTHDLWSHGHSTRPGPKDGANLLAAWHLAQPVKAPRPGNPGLPGGGSHRNAIPLYDFPSQRVTNHLVREAPLRTSALRSLGAHANVFAIESFMDELAHAAGADPVEFRLQHLKDARARAVIEAVARKAGWRSRERGDGMRGRGIGFARYKNLGCYVAVIVEIEAENEVRVKHAFAAVDAGQVINPDGIINQIEGGIIQTVSWTLKEQMNFDRERVLTRTWEDYPILTFAEAPVVEVVLLNRPAEPALGAGEGAQGPTGAAIANAVHNALGARMRDMPLTRDRLIAALAR